MNDNIGVLVADGSRARFFTLEPADRTGTRGGPTLVEIADLVNPAGQMPRKELFRSTRSGGSRAPAGGMTHGFDDHRSRHERTLAQRFARDVAVLSSHLLKDRSIDCLVLAADSRMRGYLRRNLKSPAKAGFTLREFDGDISKLTPSRIQERLAKDELLPRRQRPASR